MGKTIVKMTLSRGGVTKAIGEVKEYQRRILEKGAQLAERLAIIGAREASIRFTTAIYDGVNDVQVTAEPTEKGWRIVARGDAVAFIEFGSGVYHNPAEPYPNRPPEVAGIGEYGKGMGKRQGWGYNDEAGNHVFTRGNPAALAMYYASEEIRRAVLDIWREVFAN